MLTRVSQCRPALSALLSNTMNPNVFRFFLLCWAASRAAWGFAWLTRRDNSPARLVSAEDPKHRLTHAAYRRWFALREWSCSIFFLVCFQGEPDDILRKAARWWSGCDQKISFSEISANTATLTTSYQSMQDEREESIVKNFDISFCDGFSLTKATWCHNSPIHSSIAQARCSNTRSCTTVVPFFCSFFFFKRLNNCRCQ